MKKLFFATISALAIAGVVNAADSTQFGALPVFSKNARTLVAIPWSNSEAGDKEIVVSNLVLTANLTVNDTLDTVDADGSRLNRWVLTEGATAKYWQSVEMVGENWQNSSPDADKATVKRGSSVVLIRQNPVYKDGDTIPDGKKAGDAVPFYVMGQVASSAPTATITAGTADAPKYSLIAPPSAVAQSLNGGEHGGTWSGTIKDGDRIFVPNAPLNIELKYVNSKWCSASFETNKFGIAKKVWKTAYNTAIPLGTGFWYVSAGGSPTVTWTDIPTTSK